MRTVPVIAPPRPDVPVAIIVNFGLVVGREATPPERERLASELLTDALTVSVIGECRHNIDRHGAADVYQVRVELEPLPGIDAEALERTALERIERWVDHCRRDPGTSTLAQRLARNAVVDEDL